MGRGESNGMWGGGSHQELAAWLLGSCCGLVPQQKTEQPKGALHLAKGTRRGFQSCGAREVAIASRHLSYFDWGSTSSKWTSTQLPAFRSKCQAQVDAICWVW